MVEPQGEVPHRLVSLPVEFVMNVEPFGVLPSDAVPLLVALPYSTSAATVQITREGQVLTEVSPGSKLLRDAINAIPDFGFRKLPKERRNALQKSVNAIQNMIEAGAPQGAAEKLEHEF